MNKVAVVYWSGTGNTERMARNIVEGVQQAGGIADLLNASVFSATFLSEYDVIAFGCPAMGADALEESEFEPMFTGVEGSLSGKKTALFGSYGWGDGQWMRDWCRRCEDAGADLYDEDGLIVNEAPDEAGEEACRALGSALASW